MTMTRPPPTNTLNPNSVAGKLRALKNMPVNSSIEIMGYEPTIRATAYRLFGKGGYAMRSTNTPGAFIVWRLG